MFVRKRDPRYKAYLKSQSQPAITPSSANPPVTQTRTEPAAVYIEQEWQRTIVSGVEDLEWALAEGNDDPEVFECVACGKSFKSEAAWDSHERSKRHIKNVEAIRRQMEEEGMELGLPDPGKNLGLEPTPVTPPLDGGSGADHETPHSAQNLPKPRAQADLPEGALSEGTDETKPGPSQSEQKPSKRDKRRMREAKKQVQAVEDKHVSVWRGRADIRLKTGYRNVMFAKQDLRADRSCLITYETQATRSPSQPRTRAQKRREREENGRGWVVNP